MQTVWFSVAAAEVLVMVLLGVTFIVAFLVILPHPPVRVIVKL